MRRASAVFLILWLSCMSAAAYVNEPERIDGWSWGAPFTLSMQSLEYHGAVKGVPGALTYRRKDLRCSYLFSSWPEEVHVFLDGKYAGIILGASKYIYLAATYAKMLKLHGNPDKSNSSGNEIASLWNGQVTSIIFMKLTINGKLSVLVMLGTPDFLDRYVSANGIFG